MQSGPVRTRGGTAGWCLWRLRLCTAALINDRRWTGGFTDRDRWQKMKPVGIYMLSTAGSNHHDDWSAAHTLTKYNSRMQLWNQATVCFIVRGGCLFLSHTWTRVFLAQPFQNFIFYLQFCWSSKMTRPWDSPAGPLGHLRTAVYSVWKQRGQFLNSKTTSKRSTGLNQWTTKHSHSY